MSLTISELEAERAKILEEIENKAQKFSENTQKPEQASLNSWLNAAEEVMPATKPEKNMKTKAKSNYQSQVFKPPRNKVPFFGVFIILTLLLTLLGVIYIAYSSLHKELQNVLQAHENSTVQMTEIQKEMAVLQKSIATGGKVELFVSLEDKMFALEAQVSALKKQVSTLTASPNNAMPHADTESNPNASIPIEPTERALKREDELITESVLDNSLEKRIDQKLEAILGYLSQNKREVEGGEKISSVNKEIVAPVTPKEPNVKTPVIQQPLVQLIKAIKKPVTPKPVEEVAAPIKHYSADVKWLMNEPKMHYTLQLSSMPDAHSLQKIIDKHQLKEVRKLPQTRNGVTNYVLITGSFSDKSSANALAKKIKSELGISPWIRKIKNLTSRVQ
ncbi:MAG: SPOR domain-containing protein [Thiomicrorhabdus sp.]|nr:SPOR domain-containing protein [Thiomicrorhabdus sp.]